MSMTINEKAPGAVGAAAEGTDSTKPGRDMSTVTHTTPTSQDPDLFRDWAAAYAASWDAMIADAQQEPTWDAMVRAKMRHDDICQAHKQITGWKAPDLPASIWPDWAVRAVVGNAVGGDVAIYVQGPADGTDHGAHIETFYNVRVTPDPRGEYALGDYDKHGPQLDWPANLEALDLDDARSLRDTLTAAIAQLEATLENE